MHLSTVRLIRVHPNRALCSYASSRHRCRSKCHRTALEQRPSRGSNQPTENPQTSHVWPSRSRIAEVANAPVPPYTLRQSPFNVNATSVDRRLVPFERANRLKFASLLTCRKYAESYGSATGVGRRVVSNSCHPRRRCSVPQIPVRATSIVRMATKPNTIR